MKDFRAQLDGREEPGHCAACGAAFPCGSDAAGCWCEDLPPLAPVPGRNCLCRACLETALKERSAPGPRS